ncbi:hypothetical protein EIP91_006865 [Steccherinum ochraceum]|uniref:RING-type domain-containing protein n=1 Tax=Steccherinum ochraceum TaxID=92696 RepID=A0A4R0RLP0_9APHY|nr:hypothetical protein EIP91_006865 [Steccherinum ochraceum]
MSTRGSASKRQSTAKGELYVSVPRKAPAASKNIKNSKAETHTSKDTQESAATGSTSTRPRRASSARPSTSTVQSSKDTNARTTRSRAPSVEQTTSKPTRATDAAAATRSGSRSRRSTPAPTTEKLSKLAELLNAESDSRRQIKEEEHSLKRRRTELDHEETKLKNAERKLSCRSEKLDEREASLLQREEQVERRSAEASAELLKYMEESFSCSLCCDIMACPTSLTSICGHTFCAVCIAGWFFSKFHNECRGWHAQVECPLCRAGIRTPNTSVSPRTADSCPFSPNHVAEAALQLIVDSLASRFAREQPVVSGKGKRKRAAMDVDESDPAFEWRDGGTAREEWLVRSRKGKAKRDDILKPWTKLSPSGFLAVKLSLDA